MASPAGWKWGGKKTASARNRQRRPLGRLDLVHGNCDRGLRRREVPEPGHEATAGDPASCGNSASANGGGRTWAPLFPHTEPCVCGPAGCARRARLCRRWVTRLSSTQIYTPESRWTGGRCSAGMSAELQRRTASGAMVREF